MFMIMPRLRQKFSQGRTNRDRRTWDFRNDGLKCMLMVLLAGTMTLSGCGHSDPSSTQTPIPLSLAGNWQFTMAEQLNSDPTKPSFTGGLQGGFLLDNNGAIGGQANFLIMTQPPVGTGGQPTPCNSGVDQITGTITGQAVSLTAQSTSGQTFTLTGTLSFDNSTMTGSYSSTDGAGCGIAIASQTWSATLVPELSGSVQGYFHSMGGTAGLNEQEFVMSGSLLQDANTGASSSVVTGNLSFIDPTTTNPDYPCFGLASVNGQISGNTVSLQVVAPDGTIIGQIGQATAPATAGPQAVTLNSLGGGSILQSLAGVGYAVYAAACGGGTLQAPADSGSVCIGVNTTTACQTQLSVSPPGLVFPPQAVGSSASTLKVTLTNPHGSTVSGITLSLTNSSGAANFTEKDNCGASGASSQGQSFSLLGNQYCTVSIAFAPQQDCASGASPSVCLTGALSVAIPATDTIFDVLLIGGVTGGSASLRGIDSAPNRVAEEIVPPRLPFTQAVHSVYHRPSNISGLGRS
jgi:hypothetical protein